MGKIVNPIHKHAAVIGKISRADHKKNRVAFIHFPFSEKRLSHKTLRKTTSHGSNPMMKRAKPLKTSIKLGSISRSPMSAVMMSSELKIRRTFCSRTSSISLSIFVLSIGVSIC
ncbi:MAG: hypothetical protein V4727_07120 [Verrucomicrobiota bacterium]